MDAKDTYLGAQCDLAACVKTHLFVISPNNSGSTFVTRAIETCDQVWRLPREGQHVLGYAGPDTAAAKKELIWAADPDYLEAMRDRSQYDWHKTRKAWYFQAKANRPDASVFLTKAPPFLILVDQLREAFANARFVFLVRNPYAVVEAISRYKGGRFATREAALTASASHILRCLSLQKENIANHEDVGTFFTYEHLCANPTAAAKQLTELVPELTNLDFDQRLAVKGQYHERLRDMNADQIGRLSSDDFRIINRQFEEHEALLKNFGYAILNP